MLAQVASEETCEGVVPVAICKRVNFDDTFPIKVITVTASASRPVLLKVFHSPITAFDAGTTNVLEIGDDIDPNSILEDVFAEESVEIILRANKIIQVNYTQTGTEATEGSSDIILQVQPLVLV